MGDAINTARERSEQFDASLLSNLVYEHVQGQHGDSPLLRVIALQDKCYTFADEVEDDRINDAAFTAAEALNDVEEWATTLAVAEACRTVIEDVDEEWTDAWDREEIDAARDEADEWLTRHVDAAEAIGLEPTYIQEAGA